MRNGWDLTLFVPGLFGPPAAPVRAIAEGLSVPNLESLLSRSMPLAQRWRGDSLEGWLFRLFGFQEVADADWPVAALTYALDARERIDGWYLRADPVYLRVDINKLILFDGSAFAVTNEEAEGLAAEINAFYRSSDWRLEVPHPTRWYLRLGSAQRLRTHPISEAAAGGELAALLPEGAEGARWRRRLNEVQMLLHRSAINQAREERGERPINSLWFWGGGRLPPAPKPCWHRVWGRDSLSQALAHHVQTDYAERPAGAVTWLEQATPGRHLVILEQGDTVCRRFDVEGWRAHIGALEQDWFAPLAAALQRRQVTSLTLLPGEGLGFLMTASWSRRWWRRRRPLQYFMSARIAPHEASDGSSRGQVLA